MTPLPALIQNRYVKLLTAFGRHSLARAAALISLLVCAGALTLAGTASAALIGQNDAGILGSDSGDGFNLTFDDQSNLTWLDLTITRGFSRNQIQASSLITGGAYRYATDAEVNDLFLTNVGIGFVGSEQFTPSFANFGIISRGRTVMNFIGRTNTQIPVGSWGLVDDVTTLPGGFNTYSIRETTLPSTELLRINRGPGEASSGAFGFGSFLVQAGDVLGSLGNPFLPDEGDDPIDGFDFSIDVVDEGRTVFIDPTFAVGYDYTVLDPNGPLFASVVIPDPLPGGDGTFSLFVDGQTFSLVAGIAFDFLSELGFSVQSFSILDIAFDEGIDPLDPLGFITGLTFDGPGLAQVNQSPITETVVGVPEPGTIALFGVGLAGLALRRRRGKIN